jgi:hypothetical protein
MKHRATYQMQLVATVKTKLLLAKAEREIPVDAYLVLRKIDDVYQLVVVEQSNDTSDPVSLASFIAPEDVDAGEAFHAACIALEATKAKRKPRKKKNATASHTGGEER